MKREGNRNDLIRHIYDRRAPCYNRVVNILSCGQDGPYRKEAVKRLYLKGGECVLDLGCGTGLNFPHLIEWIGPGGSVYAVDASRGMLGEAQKTARLMGISGVSLIVGDVIEIGFRKECFDAILCTYLYSTIPEYRESLQACMEALKPGGRIVLADDILPAGWFAGPAVMIPWLLKYGWRNYLGEIIEFLRNRVDGFRVTRHHMGLIYVVSGIKKR